MNVKSQVLVAPGHHFDGWHPLHGLADFLKRQIVEEVPDELAICEFECRKEQCYGADWLTCERRTGKGAGQWSPGPVAIGK